MLKPFLPMKKHADGINEANTLLVAGYYLFA